MSRFATFHEGATKARETLVGAALRYLDSLAAEANGDAGLQRELGVAYARIAGIQGHPARPSLGHTAAALISYRKALEILEAAARSQPGGALGKDIAEEIGETLLNSSNVKAVTGDTSGARADLEKGLAVVRTAGPENVRRLHLVAALDNRLVATHLNLGHPENATAPSQEAILAARGLTEKQASAESYQLLGETYLASAIVRHYTGDLPKALGDLQESIEALNREELLHPGLSASIRQTLNWAYGERGNVAGNPTEPNLGDVKLAVESHRKSLALVEAAAADPDNLTAQAQVATVCLNLGDTLSQVDAPEAARLYKRALGITDRLCAGDSGNLTNPGYMRALDSMMNISAIAFDARAGARGIGSHRGVAHRSRSPSCFRSAKGRMGAECGDGDANIRRDPFGDG